MFARALMVVHRTAGCRLVQFMPRLTRDEVALRLAVVIPDECFASPVVDVGLHVFPENVSADQVSVDVWSAESGEPGDG